MGKYANTQVKQSDVELKKLHSVHKEERQRKRIKMLQYLKANKFKTRQELADELRIGKRTLERWVQIYEQEGIDVLLTPIKRDRDSSYISAQVHKELNTKLSDPDKAFISYKEIQHWLEVEYQVQIKYDNLYYYLKKHFKTKLKVPRKSHIKKDEQAVAFFKNARG